MSLPEHGYDAIYQAFDSPEMARVRREAYGHDIGQHSWVTVEELERDIAQLALSATSRLLDLGCGPGGPLTFIVRAIGCAATGIDSSRPALESARARVAAAGSSAPITLIEANLDQPLPVADASFDAAVSIDVVLHLRDRAAAFREIARTLVPGGRLVFSDAGVITGAVSADELALRAMHGPTHFVPLHHNERALERAGFHVIAVEDRTDSLARVAAGRRAARVAQRAAFEQLEGAEGFERQLRYLDTVVTLARRGALSRMMYAARRDS